MSETIIITGATRGIGLALANKFAECGYNLALIARDEKTLKNIKEDLENKNNVKVNTYACDISDYETVKQTITELTKDVNDIAALINNASVGHFALMKDLDVKLWQETININLLGTYYITKEILPKLLKQRRGDIINISSGAGNEGYSFCSAYSASKFGIAGFSESLMKEVRGYGIRVSLINLDTVQTDMSSQSGLKVNQWNTIMEPSDVAEVVFYIKQLPKHIFFKETSLWNVCPDRN